ncbi:MAG: alpha-amylase family glycosyl hydrolase [Trueperaceae bacterium]
MQTFKLLLLTVIFSSFLAVSSAQTSDVYYEIFVRSFQDSDGDGIGDFEGVIQRLDYLQDLGVTGLWLMPIHPSPSYHGYDVTDYYDVNPEYGTLEDFKKLVAEAKLRDIKIILDLVVNHTSNRHPWFEASSQNDEMYRDFYAWSDTDLGWKGTSGAPAWHEGERDYYLGLFWSGMPDLNFRNPAVVEEVNRVAKFWLDLGVAGFRLDAIQHIVETDGNIRNTPETFTWLKNFQAFVKSVNPEAFLVGETWTDTQSIVRYHKDADLDMSFNYPLFTTLMGAPGKAGTFSNRSALDLGFLLNQDENLYPENALRGIFISNHDQLRPASTLNIRRDLPRLKLAAELLFTLPGVPFMYYGEEIGMPNGEGTKDEEKRTPMRWDDSAQAGFSSVEPWYVFSTTDETITVGAQQADPESLLNTYKTMIALRQANPALHGGKTEVLETEANALLVFKRSTEGQTLLIAANFGSKLESLEVTSARDIVTGEEFTGSAEIGKLSLRVLEITE